MGKHSNIILLNQNNKIIDSLRHLDISMNSNRDIMPTREYIFPNSDKKDFYKINSENFLSQITESITTSIINNFAGISKSFITNLLEVTKISDTNFSQNDIKLIYNKIYYIISSIETNKIGLKTFKNNDFVIDIISNNESLQANFFLDYFYISKEKEEYISSYKNNLLKLILTALKKVSKKINNMNLKLKECSNMEKYRIYGELITYNLYQINANSNTSSIFLPNYYDENKQIEIPLDNTISISYNAKKYFKKYHKLKNTLQIVTQQKLEAEKELDYLESIVYELENANSILELNEIYQEICENTIFKVKEISNIKKNKTNKRKVHNEYEPITYTIDGFTLYVGKNNNQNDYITTKLGKNEDLWFHTKDIRGSHCLLKCNNQEVKESTILSCAQIAAYHSKAKLSSNVPVDYCFVKNVKKTSNSKPGMVIYTNNKTLYVTPKK